MSNQQFTAKNLHPLSKKRASRARDNSDAQNKTSARANPTIVEEWSAIPEIIQVGTERTSAGKPAWLRLTDFP